MTIYLEALEGLAVFSALLWIVYGPWQWVCTDYGRQILFEKRDALFDLARKQKIAFESPEYRMLRTSLETLIRFSHEVTLTRFLYLAWSLKLHQKNWNPENPIRSTINQISHRDTRHEINRLFLEAHLTLAAMIVFRSPLLLMVLLVCSPLFVFGILGAVAVGAIRQWWSFVENAAQIVGNTIQAEANSSPNTHAA